MDSDSLTNYADRPESPDAADRKYSVEIAVFHIDWNDVQLLAEKGRLEFHHANGGGAKSDGVELLGYRVAGTRLRFLGPTLPIPTRSLTTDTLIGASTATSCRSRPNSRPR